MEEPDIVEFNDYMRFTETVWLPTRSEDHGAAIEAMGLVGEAGEVTEKVKKYLHYGREIDKDALAKELGDVIFYWTRVVKRHGLNAKDIISMNMEKLNSRMARNTINGEGSDR